MNCDQVFMILTSGPFPTGSRSDVDVELHLEQCPDCWRIAEALRPAHDLFEESVPACEGRDLPGYWGDAIPARAAFAQVQQTALAIKALHDSPSQPRAMYLVPRSTTEVVGWREVVRIASFFLVVGSAAFAVAWWWH